MTTTVIAASSTPTAGDTTEPLAWAAPSVPDLGTYLELGTVTNPALRDVLAHFASECQPDLRLSETTPGAVILRRALNRAVDQRIRLFISGNAADLSRHAPVLRWLASSTGQLQQTDDLSLVGTGTDYNKITSLEESALVADVPTRASDVVQVVEWLAHQLEVPDGDILQAAKIKRRNWHNWKNGSCPRLDTQGQLWALMNSIRSLSEMFDNSPAPWFHAGGPERRELLTSGHHRKLVQNALLEATLQGEFSTEAGRRRRKRSAAGFFE